jgi:hypothetical protein
MTEPSLLVAASSHRSGSTLVQRYVTARSSTFVWGENGPFFESLLQAAEGWPQQPHNERAYERVLDDPAHSERRYMPNLSPPRRRVERAFHDAILSIYDVLPEGYDGWGWKAVGYGRREVDFVRSLFPQIRLILLVRDPWDVARSVRRKGWIDRRGYFTGVDDVARRWARSTAELARIAHEDERGSCLLLRYEDLPDRLPDLNRFLGIPNAPEREQEIITRRLGTAPRLSRFRVTAEDVEHVTRAAGDVAASLGYAPPSADGPGGALSAVEAPS